MAKLSVIVPVYNVEKYLGACLDSVLAQTYRDMEIICVNDGSTDNSAKILTDYAARDNRIKIITKKNGGQSAARNAGLAVATGDYIAFVDSDDTLHPEAYACAIAQMTPDIDVVCFGIRMVGETGAENKDSDNEYYRVKFEGKTRITTDVLSKTDVSPCNKIFRKSVIDKYGIAFPEGLRYEDAYFWTIYGLRSRNGFFIRDKFYNYLRHDGSTMHQTFTNRVGISIDHLKIAIKSYEYLKQHGLYHRYRRFWGDNFFAMLGLAIGYEKDSSEREKIYDTAIDFLRREKIDFSGYYDLERACELLCRRMYNGAVRKKCHGLVKIREKPYERRILICGIPVMRIKYTPAGKKKFLLCLLRVYNKMYNTGPRISVVMPVYNAAPYLRMAIDSVLMQTYKNFEFIIINDGSTDNSADIIREYKDARIVFVDNEENMGLVSVLNTGLDLARGEFIARMDADDISLPNRFAKQLAYLRRHRRVGVLGTAFYIFGGGVSCISTKPKRPTLHDMLKTCPIGHPTVMMRKSVLDKYKLRYDGRYRHAEDYELWLRMIRYTRFANLPDVLLNYRWHTTNVSVVHADAQVQASEIIMQRIRREMGDTHSAAKIILDDAPIIDVLKDIGHFAYMPNSGNMGDALIAAATMRWMDRNKLDWSRAMPGQNYDTFVYGGGGAWTADYISALNDRMEIMTRARRVVILPSSFNNVPQFVRILDGRFTVFCRDKKSYNYLVAQKTGARIILNHDMALRFTANGGTNTRRADSGLKKKIEKLHADMAKLPTDVRLFRRDCESAATRETDYDLSDALGWFGPYEKRENLDAAADAMIAAVWRFAHIKTDRLHVGIAGILAGVDVELYDNSYGKISGVYEQSLATLPNADFIME